MKSTEEIYQEMCAEFKKKSGVELNDGGDMAVRFYAAAAQIYSLYLYGEWVKKQSFPQFAIGEYLDLQAQMRGLERNDAVKAEGKIRFSIGTALEYDLPIENGTVCTTASGTNFITAEDAEIKAGELYCDVPAKAENAGSVGNVASGTIRFMTVAPVGVSSCNNPERFTGGMDKESDESLRKRVVSSYNKLPNGANKAYYEKEVLGVDGVVAVSVMPKVRGLGTVDIIISGASGMPTEKLIGEVNELIQNKREICVDISVSAPEKIEADITVAVEPESGYEFDEVKNAVDDAVSGYFDGKLLGKNVLLAKIGNIIYGVKGVKNYKITSPTADVEANEDELPVIGTLTIDEWS